MTFLEEEILDIINKAVEGKYISTLKVMHEDDWYTLLLYMDSHETPIALAYQGDVDGFKDFVYKEMRNRKMELVSYWGATMELPPDELHDDGSVRPERVGVVII